MLLGHCQIAVNSMGSTLQSVMWRGVSGKHLLPSVAWGNEITQRKEAEQVHDDSITVLLGLPELRVRSEEGDRPPDQGADAVPSGGGAVSGLWGEDRVGAQQE